MDEVDALQPLLILVSFGIFDTASVHAKEGCLPTVLSRQLVHLLCSWAACRSEISIEVDDHWFADNFLVVPSSRTISKSGASLPTRSAAIGPEANADCSHSNS
eukprot:TRINITY_DN15401_c0_g1_i1.p1 TRINITY_DN15401_c0_g1~~TRINITY_DN15401_c0_g1_i1.p1  ORF type:complete len:103 (-),score=14.39 TRINITY_DN15401_c0_g1_i1:26-334(-)